MTKESENTVAENELSIFDLAHEPAAYEIAPGITVEEMRADFFDDTALRLSNNQLYRLDRKTHRYYYEFNEQGEPEFFPSITTLISQTTPTSEHLSSWKDVMGYLQTIIDNVFSKVFPQPGIMAAMYTNERANYGTFMHGEYAKMIINKRYNLDELINELANYAEREKLPATFIDYADDLRKNMLSLAQFIIDTDLQPLAVEISLICREGGFACTLDLPCIISYRGERFPCIIDFKSGKHFYENNEIQLFGCRMAWNENFPDLKIERVFNWRPKDWRSKPTYEFKEQTYSQSEQKLPYLLKLAAIEDQNMDNSLIICSGEIELGEKANIKDNFKSLTLAELVKSKKTEDETPEAEPEAKSLEEIAGEKAPEQPQEKKRTSTKAKTPEKKTGPKKAAKGPKTEEPKSNDLEIHEIDF